MQCPKCDVELAPAVRHQVSVQSCASCKGMWFSREGFTHLEDEAFDLDEHAKGTLVFDAEPAVAKCPECGSALTRFNYRAFDLVLELCDAGHGFWLEEGQDARVLEFMKVEERDIDRSQGAERKWRALVRRLHSGGFLGKVRDLLE